MGNGSTDDKILDPATVVFIVCMIMATLVWFLFPPIVWDFSDEDSQTWSANDFRVDRAQFKEIMRKNNLCFRVAEGDIRNSDKSEVKKEEHKTNTHTNTTPLPNAALSDVEQIGNGGSALMIKDGGLVCIDIESGQDSIAHDVDHCNNNGTCGGSVCECNSCSDRVDVSTTSSLPEIASDRGFVLKIPCGESSHLRRSSSPIDCAICLDKFKLNDEVAFSNNHECCHVFHLDCIAPYIENTKGAEKPCPCCRQCFLSVPMFLHNENDDMEDTDLQEEEESTGSAEECYEKEDSYARVENFLAL
eukprot:jgi/Psemu1/37072/gm1.37072_g